MWQQAEFLLRIVVAGACGAIIGYERKSRLKEAGIRTHFIVALASALMMIISKYGFFDVFDFAKSTQDVRLDPSRVASTIITGVGFLGAGAIFIRKNTINGLTTAAGIWATSGVGMAVGSGFYYIGIASAVIILIVQVLLHKNTFITKNIPNSETIKIVVQNTEGALSNINELMAAKKVEIINIKTEIIEKGGFISMELHIKVPSKMNPIDIVNIFEGCDHIKSIDL